MNASLGVPHRDPPHRFRVPGFRGQDGRTSMRGEGARDKDEAGAVISTGVHIGHGRGSARRVQRVGREAQPGTGRARVEDENREPLRDQGEREDGGAGDGEPREETRARRPVVDPVVAIRSEVAQQAPREHARGDGDGERADRDRVQQHSAAVACAGPRNEEVGGVQRHEPGERRERERQPQARAAPGAQRLDASALRSLRAAAQNHRGEK